jgi:hypothetical protein
LSTTAVNVFSRLVATPLSQARRTSPSHEFAIVITLLVLPITVDVNLPEVEGGLAWRVWALWPKVLAFVVSFLRSRPH